MKTWFWRRCRVFAILLIAGLAFRAPAAAENAARKQADELLARQKYPEAAAAYERLAVDQKTDKSLAAYALFQVGVCRLKDKRVSDAFTTWARLRIFYPDSPQVPQSLLLEAQNTTDSFRARTITEEILTKYPTAPEAATILIQRGETAFAAQEYPAATAAWEQFVARFPKHRQWAEIKKKAEIAALSAQGDRAAASELDAPKVIAEADALFDRAAFKESARLYNQFLDRFPTKEQTAHVAGRLAQCEFLLGHTEDAVALLQKMAARMPQQASALLGQIVVQTASQRKLDPLREKAMQLLLQQYPNKFAAQQALFVDGAVALGRGNHTAASNSWAQLLERYPNTEFRATIEKELKLVAQPQPPHKLVAPPPPKPNAEELAAQREREQKQREMQARQLEAVWHNALAMLDERVTAAQHLARTYALLGQNDKALVAYQWIWQQAPQNPVADLAVWEAAQVCLAMKDDKQATEHFTYLINQYPQSRWRPVALWCLGNRRVLYAADLNGAWEYYGQLLREYPQHPLAERTRTEWALLQKLKPAELREQVADFLQTHRRKQHA